MRKEGGQGLVSVRATVHNEMTDISKMATTDCMLSEQLKQQKPKKEEEQGEEPSWKDSMTTDRSD